MDGYVTVAEAARQLGRSIEQVRRYLREGRLPGRRIGQQWFIEEDALTTRGPGQGRASTPRVSEALATYKARPMKRDDPKKREHLLDKELLAEIDRIREEIRKEYGEFDVVRMVRESRDSH
ncbi:MAG: helix-turn-helix domain-containing protein [Vicinamibacterales bacterium]